MAGHGLAGASAALCLLASAASATTQAPTPPATSNATAAAPDTGLHDRVLALVQTRKCSAAHDEAIKGGDDLLAQQVSELCGLKPTRDSGGSKSRKAPGGSGGSGAPGGPGSLGRRGV